MYKVPLFKLNYNEQENLAVERVISSGWLTMGTKTLELEKNFSSFLGKESKCVAVSSCTAALHLSLLALDVGKNDEILVPSLSFVAQLNVIKNLGAKPVLVDCSSLDNWNMAISSVRKKITRKTRAIIILHYAGYPCEIPKNLKNFCKNNNIFIIEDVAHAPGAEIDNSKCGTLGDLACFSFFSNKNISAGEGGIVATKHSYLEKKIRYLRSHGMTTLSIDKIKGRAVDYDVVTPGLNYRLDDMRSTLALIQFKKLKKANLMRAKHVNLYQKLLENTDIKFPFIKVINNFKSAYHILPILLPKNLNRGKLITKLKNMGIQTSVHYPAFWSFSIYKDLFIEKDFPICSEVCKRELTLPLYPSMKENDIILVCRSLIRAIS